MPACPISCSETGFRLGRAEVTCEPVETGRHLSKGFYVERTTEEVVAGARRLALAHILLRHRVKEVRCSWPFVPPFPSK